MATAWICGMKERRSQEWCWVRWWHRLTGCRDEKQARFRTAVKNGLTSACDRMEGLRTGAPGRRAGAPEQTLTPGKTEGRRRRRQRMRWLESIIDSTDGSLSRLRETLRTGKPGVLQSAGSQTEPPQTGWIYAGYWSDEERSDLGLTGLKRVVKMRDLMMSQ